uniref:Uncharacterized protein n=1 Tax=Pithovirus LCPAC404 TaxID=2506597 RepID=A0A481ZCV1_9VIRU|nr:MAG: hypothetical protein LCPAC404_02100 [Pithovirus LCPAC404]
MDTEECEYCLLEVFFKGYTNSANFTKVLVDEKLTIKVSYEHAVKIAECKLKAVEKNTCKFNKANITAAKIDVDKTKRRFMIWYKFYNLGLRKRVS